MHACPFLLRCMEYPLTYKYCPQKLNFSSYINQYIFKKPMQSEKAYYLTSISRIAGFFNAGRPVATPAGPANLVLKEETPWYQKSSLNLYRHTAGT